MMASRSATERHMFDIFNACPWDTAELATDHAVEILVAGGMRRPDAETVASAAYERWNEATKIMRPM